MASLSRQGRRQREMQFRIVGGEHYRGAIMVFRIIEMIAAIGERAQRRVCGDGAGLELQRSAQRLLRGVEFAGDAENLPQRNMKWRLLRRDRDSAAEQVDRTCVIA